MPNWQAVMMFQAALVKAPEHPAGMCGLASAFLGQALECRSMGAVLWSAVLLQVQSHPFMKFPGVNYLGGLP